MNKKKMCVCMYCGFRGLLESFLIRQKDGFSHTRVKCPKCGIGYTFKRLNANISMFEWGEWVYYTLRTRNPRQKDMIDYDAIKVNISHLYSYADRHNFWDGFIFMKARFNIDGVEIFSGILDRMALKKKATFIKLDAFISDGEINHE